MAEKTRIIEVHEKSSTFSSVIRRFTGQKDEYNFKDLSILRKLLTNEKARLLHVIKEQKPSSIYGLSKILKRDFKTVREDVLLLKKFGFIDLIEGKSKGKRLAHKPVISATTVNIVIRI